MSSIKPRVTPTASSTVSTSCQAQELWKDLYALQIQAKSDTEPRFALIARMEGKVWSVFFTERSSKIRIISARRSRTNEEDLYHEGRAT